MLRFAVVACNKNFAACGYCRGEVVATGSDANNIFCHLGNLVIVALYPFEDTVASGASDADIIEKIDIGGISLIRAGAKNFKDVIIVPSKAEYKPLLDLLQQKNGTSDIEDRKWFATQAFGVSSHYDTAIHNWFSK